MPMPSFIQKYEPHVTGVLDGFDRLVFRGMLRLFAMEGGMLYCLHQLGVLLKDFGAWAEASTRQLKEASLEAARELDRPITYLASSQVSKEVVARAIAERDGIREGLIGVLTCVEPCRSYQVHRDAKAKKLVLQPWLRKGLCLYHYWMDRDFGLMHARVQSWLPYSIQVCLNGREWLARRLDREGIAYRKEDNAFPWIEDVARAQELFEELRRWPWEAFLEGIGARVNPAKGELFRACPVEYYWTVHQSEWATDVMLDSRATLQRLYALLTRGAMEAFSCEQIIRFLGRRLSGRFEGEIESEYRRREEGV
jgi:hypothetical protein